MLHENNRSHPDFQDGKLIVFNSETSAFDSALGRSPTGTPSRSNSIRSLSPWQEIKGVVDGIFLNILQNNVKSTFDGCQAVLRDSEDTDIPFIAPGFGSDFVVLIEQNRRRSIGYVEDFAIEARRNMARRRDAR